jgi:hypothetical protein
VKQVMKPLRVYLNPNKEGVVTCPHCSLGKMVNMSNYPDYFGGKSLKISCKRCRAAFYVKFDHRQHSRITVDIPGKLLQSMHMTTEKNIVITSLSVTGIGFIVSDAANVNVDDILTIRFHLDDGDRSVIEEQVTVRRISGAFIGAEYCNDAYRHELDFYVMRPLAYV